MHIRVPFRGIKVESRKTYSTREEHQFTNNILNFKGQYRLNLDVWSLMGYAAHDEYMHPVINCHVH